MKRKWLWILVASAIIVLSGWISFIRPLIYTKVYAGVALEGVDISGKTREQVAQILTMWQKEQHNKQIMVYYGDTIFRLDAQNIDFDIDVDATLEDIWNYGRRGSWWERLKNIRMATQQGYRMPVRIRYNENKLDSVFESWRDAIDRPPRNAALSILTGGIIPQEQGRKLETEALRPIVLQALKKPDTNSVPLPVTPLYPEITVADINRAGIREVMGTYTTTFDAKDSNRTTNIRIAASKINGHIIYPGQTFSFNETVGPREKTYGFKEAMEIVDGELVPGIGGGICQVSSTLYNAALLSNLNVVERYNHSKPLVYVPLGRDATVVFGMLDFKFVNETDMPVMIMAEINNDKLCIGIFGQKRMAETVEIFAAEQQVIQPAVVKEQDNQLYLGETKVDKQGRPGYEVTTIRVVRTQGREIKREVLATDRYLPEDTIVKVGSQLPPFVHDR